MKNHIYINIILAVIGVYLPFLNQKLSMAFGVIAFILLALVQISLFSSSGKWAIIGAKPSIKLVGTRKLISISSVVMLISLLIGLFTKIVLLKNAL